MFPLLTAGSGRLISFETPIRSRFTEVDNHRSRALEIPITLMVLTQVLFPTTYTKKDSNPGGGDGQSPVGFAFTPATGLFDKVQQVRTTVSPATAFLSPLEAPETKSLSVSQTALVRRVSSLETSIEYQKTAHSEQLKGLHAEISRLQGVCNELTVKLSCAESGQGFEFPLDFCKSQSLTTYQ